MPFLGKQPPSGFSSYTKQDLTADGSTTGFTLNKNVASANDVEVFVGNVRQEPTDAYTVSGNTLTMSAAPSSGTNFYVMFKEATQSTTVPAAGTTVPGNFSASGTLSSTGDLSTTEGNIFLPAGSYIRGSARVSDGETVGTPSNRIIGTSTTATNIYGEDYIRIGIGSGGGEVGRWTSSGLSFDSGSNHLDDYEEGTFTYNFSVSSGSISVRAGYQSGYYTKIGRAVHIQLRFETISQSSPSGDVYITGLPFASVGNPSSGSNSQNYPIHARDFSGVTNFGHGIANFVGNTTQIRFLYMNNNGSPVAITGSNIGSNFQGTVDFTYITDA